ncbi:MAG TPA: ATP-dependent DNA ligase [Firmicutes bacterium]|nr:ATP-dependent DNA ligase [Bacillota bacterium]
MLFHKLIEPMLAVDHPQPFDSNDYLYEVKWDGYRCMAYCDGDVKLFSRNQKELTHRFPEIADALRQLPVRCVLDGELIAFGADQLPSFSLLQSKSRGAKGITSSYVVFDLLYLDGRYLFELPLVERRSALASSVEGFFTAQVVTSRVIAKEGIKFFQAVSELNLEGIIAKRKDSVYLPGKRSRAWLKIKHRLETYAIVVGYIPEPHGFKSLILAQYDQGRLVYVGNVGTGFSQRDKAVLMTGLTKIHAPCPLANKPEVAQAVWVKPVLVAQITYLEYTADNKLRQASFVGLCPNRRREECTVQWRSDL